MFAVFLYVYLALYSKAPAWNTDKRLYDYNNYVRLRGKWTVVEKPSYVLAGNSSNLYNPGGFLSDTASLLLPVDGGDGWRGVFGNGNICSITLEMVRRGSP